MTISENSVGKLEAMNYRKYAVWDLSPLHPKLSKQ